jgi:hypothetical protein
MKFGRISSQVSLTGVDGQRKIELTKEEEYVGPTHRENSTTFVPS